jgi:hypothetical protein
LSFSYKLAGSEPQSRPNPIQTLLNAKGIGIEMARGIDLDEHLRQVRED